MRLHHHYGSEVLAYSESAADRRLYRRYRPENLDMLPPAEARDVVDAARQLRDAATALMENQGDDSAVPGTHRSATRALRAVGAIAVHDPLNDGRRRLHKRTIRVRESAVPPSRA